MADYMFECGFRRYQVGYGSAIAVVMFVLGLVFALAYQRYVLRRDLEGAMTDAGSSAMTEPGAPRPDGSRRVATAPDLRSCVGAASSSSRSLYGVLGGFKDNGQLATNPFGLPEPVGRLELHRHPGIRGRSGASSATAP